MQSLLRHTGNPTIAVECPIVTGRPVTVVVLGSRMGVQELVRQLPAADTPSEKRFQICAYALDLVVGPDLTWYGKTSKSSVSSSPEVSSRTIR